MFKHAKDISSLIHIVHSEQLLCIIAMIAALNHFDGTYIDQGLTLRIQKH